MISIRRLMDILEELEVNRRAPSLQWLTMDEVSMLYDYYVAIMCAGLGTPVSVAFWIGLKLLVKDWVKSVWF